VEEFYVNARHGDEMTGREKAFVAVLIFLAAVLRLWRLDQGFWYDEIFSLTNFFRAEWPLLFTSMKDPNHHPLYSILAKLSISALGEREWSARLPAFSAGTASVPLLYLMGRRFLGREAAAMGSLFYCINMWHVYFSQDARGYSMMMLLSLFSWWLFLLLMEKTSLLRGVLYLAVTVGCVYTHLYSASVPAGHLLVAVVLSLRAGEAKRKSMGAAWLCAASLLLSGLAYLPMVRELVQYAGTEGKITGGREFSPAFAAGLFKSWASGSDNTWLSLPGLVFAGAGVLFMAVNKRLFLASWLVPLAAGFTVPLVTGTFVYHRFYAFAMPGFMLAVGYGVSNLRKKLKLPAWATFAAAALVVATMLPALAEYYRLGKQGLRPAAEWIQKNAPGATVYTLGLAGDELLYYVPKAIPLPKRFPLNREMLADSVVVFAFPWSVNVGRQQYLDRVCGYPVRFMAAGYDQNEVRLYRCE